MFTRSNPTYSQPSQFDQPMPSSPDMNSLAQGTELPRAQGAFAGSRNSELYSGRDARPLSSPRGGDRKTARFAAGVNPPPPPTSSIPMVQGVNVNRSSSPYRQQQQVAGSSRSDAINRLSSPRAKEFAQGRTQVKKPIKAAKASDMI